MSRSADYTIQGFLYQFHKSLLEILSKPIDASVSIEGIIEDVDVKIPTGTEAIQCKYHEAVESFTLSKIYKPVIQMMDHFHKSGNKSTGITYILYAYFPNMKEEELQISEDNINQMLSTKNQKLIKIIEPFKENIDIKEFLKHFRFEFGSSIEELKEEIFMKLLELDFKKDYIDNLIYPNAINIIAKTSTLHSAIERTIKIQDFLENLRRIKNTALTKWTLSLKNYDSILKTRRKQLRAHLQINNRKRYFLIKDVFFEDFDDNIVTFIKEYLDKYHFKVIHESTPIFCLDCCEDKFDDILVRLKKKHIKVNYGYISLSSFDEDTFFKEPIVEYSNGKIKNREFDIRLLHVSKHKILNRYKADDLILISNKDYSLEDIDVNIERIELNDINAIKFVMGMRDTYE